MNEIICVYCGKTITDESAIQLYDENYNMLDAFECTMCWENHLNNKENNNNKKRYEKGI